MKMKIYSSSYVGNVFRTATHLQKITVLYGKVILPYGGADGPIITVPGVKYTGFAAGSPSHPFLSVISEASGAVIRFPRVR